MSGPEDDLFVDNPAFAAAAEEIGRHRAAIYERISTYMDENDIPDGAMADLLIDMAVRLRMVAYGFEVEKPSASGLKLDLDRFAREFTELVRDVKKDAAELVENIKALYAQSEDSPE